jgi:hypothetical protein
VTAELKEFTWDGEIILRIAIVNLTAGGMIWDSVLNRYGLRGLIRLAVDVIYTKLFIDTEALIRRRPAIYSWKEVHTFWQTVDHRCGCSP